MIMVAKPHQRAVRQAARLKVTARTVAQVPVDTWLLVCMHFFSGPQHVFRLMVACRGIWGALKAHPVWWEAFYRRVLQYQDVLTASPYAKVLHRYETHSDKHRVLKLVFVRICEACGTRQGHTLLHPLMARLCTLCVQQRVVSNRVLLKRYGLHFSDFLLAYHASGGVVIAHRQNVKKTLDHSSNLLWLTCEPLDFETRRFDRVSGFKHQLLFFCVKDLERVLGMTLPQARQRHQERVGALERVWAQCRMVQARRAMNNAYMSVHDILVNDRWNQIQSSLRQQQLESGRCNGTLMMGGPYAMMLVTMKAGFQCTQAVLRPGLCDADVRKLRVIVEGASQLT